MRVVCERIQDLYAIHGQMSTRYPRIRDTTHPVVPSQGKEGTEQCGIASDYQEGEGAEEDEVASEQVRWGDWSG